MSLTPQGMAAAELLAIIDELTRNADDAQAMNRTYKAFILSQSLKIETLETELRIARLEIELLRASY